MVGQGKFPLHINWHSPKGKDYFYIPLSTEHSLYPLTNISNTILRLANDYHIKLPNISLKFLNLFTESTEQRPYGRIPYAVIIKSLAYISEQTGIHNWYIDRYMPGFYFPLEKFIYTIRKLKASVPIEVYIEIPQETDIEGYSDEDIIMALLSIPNFAIKKQYAEQFTKFNKLFIKANGPILIAKDKNLIFSLIKQATTYHVRQALKIIGTPKFLGALLSLYLPDRERQDYITRVLRRYIDEEYRFITSYHLIESTIKPSDLEKNKDILKYTIKALAYTGMVGKLGKYIISNIDKLPVGSAELFFLLSRIASNTNLPTHDILYGKLETTYHQAQNSSERILSAYGLITLATYSEHTASVKELLENNPIKPDIDIPNRVLMLKIASIYKGIYPDVIKYIPLLRDTLEEVETHHIPLKGLLIGSLAFLIENRKDITPSVPLTMYWQAMELDPMHSGEYFWLWFTLAPHAGLKYDTVKHFFDFLVLDIYDVFKPSELITIYSAMAEASLQYGHVEDYKQYMSILQGLTSESTSQWGKNMYYRLQALYSLEKEDIESLEKIFNSWQCKGILLYWNDTKRLLNRIIHLFQSCQDYPLPTDNEILIYLHSKYCKNKNKDDYIDHLKEFLSLYTRQDDILNAARTHTYLYRLLKDTQKEQALEHAIASSFLYKEIDGLPPADIQALIEKVENTETRYFINLLIKKYIDKSRLLESILSIISSSSKEEIMSKLLKTIPLPFFSAYGKYVDKHTTIEGIYSVIGISSPDGLNIPSTTSSSYTQNPATAFINYQVGDKQLFIYIEHRYASDIYNEETIRELTAFASELINILSRVHIVEKSQYDSLTGLLTRWFLVEEGPRMWNRAQMESYPISLIFMDIDNFKNINDTLGHDIGDMVLKTVANIIKGETRISDKAIRYGGDEFLIILPYLGNQETYNVAQRIKTHVGNIPLLKKYNITLSMGIYTSHNKLALSEAIKLADKAMYMAKKKGKNQIAVYKP